MFKIFSDLHLGVRDANDSSNYLVMERWLPRIADSQAKIIIAGDLFDITENTGPFEFSQDCLDRIREAHYPIASLIADLEAEGRCTIIEGNHDWGLGHGEGLTLTQGNKFFKVLHGHQWDGINSGAGRSIGETLTKVGAFLEAFWPQGPSLIEDSFRDKELRAYDERVDIYARAMNGAIQDEGGPTEEVVIVGHSHRPGVHKHHINAGCWTWNRCDVVTVYDDGRVVLGSAEDDL